MNINAQLNVHNLSNVTHMEMYLTELFAQSDRHIEQTDLGFKRYLFARLPWQDRLIGIKGGRGVGKTTLLLQKLKSLDMSSPRGVYLPLDDLPLCPECGTRMVIQELLDEGKSY